MCASKEPAEGTRQELPWLGVTDVCLSLKESPAEGQEGGARTPGLVSHVLLGMSRFIGNEPCLGLWHRREGHLCFQSPLPCTRNAACAGVRGCTRSRCCSNPAVWGGSLQGQALAGLALLLWDPHGRCPLPAHRHAVKPLVKTAGRFSSTSLHETSLQDVYSFAFSVWKIICSSSLSPVPKL